MKFIVEELWVIYAALYEYSKDPINDQHGIIAINICERIRQYILKGEE